MTELPARRLLLVHAHPDDETINNGATMAKYAAEGAHVTLVTCTLGEEGEVIPPELAHLASDRDDTLGPYRIGELAAAMARTRGHRPPLPRRPGPLPRLRDDGRRRRTTAPTASGRPTSTRPPATWWRSSARCARRSWSTYDPNGGYGHPDHIQAHRVAMRAADLAADAAFRPELGAPHAVDRIYWNCMPRSVVEEGFARLRAAGRPIPFEGVASADDVPGVVDDADGHRSRWTARAYAERKAAAMRAHATQIAVDGPFFALSNDLGQPVFSTEYFRLVRGTAPGGGSGRDSWADDVFAGLADGTRG